MLSTDNVLTTVDGELPGTSRATTHDRCSIPSIVTRTAAPRVMHVITPSRMAGAETYLVRLMRRGASAASHSCICKPSPANDEMRAAGIAFDTLRIGGKANFLAVPRLARAARQHKAQLLHSHLSTASWWCGWLEQFGGPPSIGHVHGFTSARWHRQQTHLIACSAAVKKDLIEKGIASDRITVMHYPVDPDDMQPTRTRLVVRGELGASPDTPVVGTFAHLSPKKEHKTLIQAAALVLNVFPKAQFWCFGEGPLRPELEQTARELGIADRFKLFGFRRNVPDLMQAIDVMCLPSRREPFGLVYVEAALAAKPVIACDAGGAPEIIVNGETGLLIPPPQSTIRNPQSEIDSPPSASVTALADALFTLLDNRATSAAMGRRGREMALERFGWSYYLTRLSRLYAEICAR
jgi:glycosyltransferase involved in cell wall biosynthesis